MYKLTNKKIDKIIKRGRNNREMIIKIEGKRKKGMSCMSFKIAEKLILREDK
jgi:hypothetical protein